MTLRTWASSRGLLEDLHFLFTNRIPRRMLTYFVGWVSKQEHPLIFRPAMWLWQRFSDLDLSEARQTHFRSVHECFTRELKPGLRPIDVRAEVITSPCDAIVGACGQLQGVELIQAKGFGYTLPDLLGDAAWAEKYRDGSYVTLRLTASMYHRFHAPCDGTVYEVNYLSGDVWNVHPIALTRVEKLFCKNERAVIKMHTAVHQYDITLVPVAAVLVASIRLHFLNVLLHLRYRGANVMRCKADVIKGQEMGWFEHGSTIIVFAPKGFFLCPGIESGARLRMGEALMQMPDTE